MDAVLLKIKFKNGEIFLGFVSNWENFLLKPALVQFEILLVAVSLVNNNGEWYSEPVGYEVQHLFDYQW